jgi:hypothetical protein
VRKWRSKWCHTQPKLELLKNSVSSESSCPGREQSLHFSPHTLFPTFSARPEDWENQLCGNLTEHYSWSLLPPTLFSTFSELTEIPNACSFPISAYNVLWTLQFRVTSSPPDLVSASLYSGPNWELRFSVDAYVSPSLSNVSNSSLYAWCSEDNASRLFSLSCWLKFLLHWGCHLSKMLHQGHLLTFTPQYLPHSVTCSFFHFHHNCHPPHTFILFLFAP